MYPGQSNTTYAFYSTATDQAGNTQVNSPRIEASTYVRDFTPPVTTVDSLTGANPTIMNTMTGTFTLELTGTDGGGSGLAYFQVFASEDGRPYTEIGPYAVPAGAPNADGTYTSSVTFQGITDGQHHSYSFYSVGLDNASNLQTAPASPNLIVASQVFSEPSQLLVTGLTVDHGSPSRSFVRYLDLPFNESDTQSGGELTAIVNSITGSSPDIQIFKYDLNDDVSTRTPVPLSSATILTVIDHAIEIDFGAGGIGGSPLSTTADGYYEIDVHLPGGRTAVHYFDRLLGDVTGDGCVDANDLNDIAASIGASSPLGWTPLTAAVTGDGAVSAIDLTLATRSKGRKLGANLSLG